MGERSDPCLIPCRQQNFPLLLRSVESDLYWRSMTAQARRKALCLYAARRIFLRSTALNAFWMSRTRKLPLWDRSWRRVSSAPTHPHCCGARFSSSGVGSTIFSIALRRILETQMGLSPPFSFLSRISLLAVSASATGLSVYRPSTILFASSSQYFTCCASLSTTVMVQTGTQHVPLRPLGV